MQNMQTWYLYTISATGMLGMLERNMGGDIHITELLTTPSFQMYTEL
jgi:hypothetical protein